ncbi:hypothetical protein Syun_026044 [Stephania yunnanensis]|uniref:Uncharacterized protein n=1 Tax=Stephania yunnanensis TaxID=152371 RepID=A0AAP0HVW5_9MAGN
MSKNEKKRSKNLQNNVGAVVTHGDAIRRKDTTWEGKTRRGRAKKVNKSTLEV